jgi:uncharacterized OsmC-like protein
VTDRPTISFTYDAAVAAGEGLIKTATVTRRGNGENTWTLVSDEPRVIGGGNTAPPPVAFLTASVGFCLLTHLVQHTRMLRMTVDGHRVEVTASWHQTGSVLRGDVRGHCDGIDVVIEIDSAESEDRIHKLVTTSVQGCFVIQTLRTPVSVSASVNGAPPAPVGLGEPE